MEDDDWTRTKALHRLLVGPRSVARIVSSVLEVAAAVVVDRPWLAAAVRRRRVDLDLLAGWVW